MRSTIELLRCFLKRFEHARCDKFHLAPLAFGNGSEKVVQSDIPSLRPAGAGDFGVGKKLRQRFALRLDEFARAAFEVALAIRSFDFEMRNKDLATDRDDW